MQDANYGARHIGIDLQPVDFVKLAEAFGVPGRKVTQPGELKPVLERAMEEKEPFLIEVTI
jgi:thiamine pyrophosphate-dependent acetolactate synthase large subunit-like protein